MTDSPPNPKVESGETAYTKLVTKVKRGTGTRDQDTVKVTTRHPDPDIAARRHEEAIRTVRRSAEMARTIQPEGETDGE
jgi:hypothetical protein